MNLLTDQLVLAVESAADSAIARYFTSLGATVERVTLAQLRQRLPQASFLIEQLGLPALADAGLAREALTALNPRLVHVSVTCFGSSGPRARWRGNELIATAMGGTLLLTGEPDRPPVKEALEACGFHAQLAGAAGALAAHYERGRSGQGQHVDICVQQVAASRLVNSMLVWHFDKRRLHRVGGALNYGIATVRCIWALADGWCFHTLMTGRFGAPANQGLSDWIDASGLDNPLRGTDWLRYNRSTLAPETRARWEAAIAAFFRTRTKAQIAEEGRRRGINATVIATPFDVLADPHLKAREYWRQEGSHRVPARFVRIVQGTHGAARPEPPGPATRPGPLAGVRVLDFSWALVGSITTKILGDLGAEVVKVESRTRPCLSRLDVQVSVSQAGNLDDKPWFAHLNTSKRSLALDMKKAESREVLEPLIRWADVVVENFSPGTMAKLGLDYAQLSARNPGIIMVSGSVYGQTGPLAQEWGVDGTGGALSGRTYLTGWPDRDPVVPGAVPYGDVIVPYAMAAAAAAALQRRREKGIGCHVDASMYELCVQQMSASLRQAQEGHEPRRQGNAEDGVFHQGVYPVEGEDRWIALSCATASDWQALRRFADLADGADEATRHELLGAWTRTQQGAALVERLQAAGHAAGRVQDIRDLLEDDEGLAQRGLLVSLQHALLGEFGHLATPMAFSRSRLAPFRAPSMGEHSRQIAGEIAGLPAEQIDALERKGVFQ